MINLKRYWKCRKKFGSKYIGAFQELNFRIDEVESNKNLFKKYLDKSKVENNRLKKQLINAMKQKII